MTRINFRFKIIVDLITTSAMELSIWLGSVANIIHLALFEEQS